MKQMLIDYVEIVSKIEKLNKQKTELESQILSVLNSVNKEHAVIDNIAIAICYRSKFEYDTKAIHDILEPKDLFTNVASINKDKLNFTMRNTPAISENEIEQLLSSVKVKNTKEYLRCRLI